MTPTHVSEFLQYVSAEKGLSENTRQAYARDLKQFLEYATIKRLTLEQMALADVRGFLAVLRRRGVGPRSLARKVSALKQFFQFHMRESRLQASPAELLTVVVKSRRLPKHLTVDEVFKLIDCALGDGPNGIRDRAMLEMWYATGCRVSELAELGSGDIDWKGSMVRLRGKGGRERWVPMGAQALEWAERYRGIRHEWVREQGLEDESDVFFLSDRRKPYSRQGLWKWLKARAEAAGIQRKLWPHMIRHSFATHVLQGGADLRMVQELLGHRSISTTEMYTHLNVENLKTMQRKFHPRS